jgi:hypothetical protein
MLRQPREVTGLLRALERWRWPVLAVWSSLLALRVGHGNDWQLLRLAARNLTGRQGLHLYADTRGRSAHRRCSSCAGSTRSAASRSYRSCSR